MSNKINQHYVWKNYLKPWTVNRDIQCLRNKENLFTANPRNVGSQRYFYRIDGITLNDCEIIQKAFIDPMRNTKLRELSAGWLEPILAFLKSYKSAPFSNEIQKEKDEVLKVLVEDLHMRFENSGYQVLEKVQSGDVSFLAIDNQERIDFICYLCVQYLRTKNMKQNAIERLEPFVSHFSNLEATINLLVPILATPFSLSLYSLILNKKLNCFLLKNSTDVPFITGDQPVINTLADKDNKETTELELYYPVTPHTALIITKKQNMNIVCAVDDVHKFNNLIAFHSHEQLYANSKSILENYKTTKE